MDERPAAVGVIGAGSWGTALAQVFAKAGCHVTLWARRPELADAITNGRENLDYLPGVKLPDELACTSDLRKATSSKKLLVLAAPAQAMRSVAAAVNSTADNDAPVLCVAKGIETGRLLRMSEVIHQEMPEKKEGEVGVLYGPGHAEEIAQGLPAALVVAPTSERIFGALERWFEKSNLRIYSNQDLLGVEIAGSVKNVMAIATGISDGVGFGDNAKSALLTRGLAEIARLGIAMGAKAETFYGLAGIGDLVVTCMSRHSRNRSLGEQIGKGQTLEQVQAKMRMVAEGVQTTRSTVALARQYDVEMPISEAVHAILFEGKKPRQAVTDLMTRSFKNENQSIC